MMQPARQMRATAARSICQSYALPAAVIDVILDHAGMKGTGTWTVQTALMLGVPVTGIAEAVFARGLSSETELRDEAAKQHFAGPQALIELGDDERKAFIDDIRHALYASKIIAYAQGFTTSGCPVFLSFLCSTSAVISMRYELSSVPFHSWNTSPIWSGLMPRPRRMRS